MKCNKIMNYTQEGLDYHKLLLLFTINKVKYEVFI